MIKRDKYLQYLINSKNNGFPKVITGIRRCGKSYLLEKIYKDYLFEQGIKENDILIIRLDQLSSMNYRNPIELEKYVSEYSRNKEIVYVFIDEIQMMQSIINPVFTNGEIRVCDFNDDNAITYVDLILELSRRDNIDLYVTGSNSKMLSKDIITQFRDKATQIKMNPLSFEEYYNHIGGYKEEALQDYLIYGGMPLVIMKRDDEQKKNYLKELFETTYLKDIIERNKLRKSEALDELCNIISSYSGQLLNSKIIADTYVTVSKMKIEKHTIENYINYFIDSFIISEAKRYDVKGKKEIGSLKKYYYCDMGLRNARLNFAYSDEGCLLENCIYNELIYNGYTVNVGQLESIEKDFNGKSIRKTYEIDFIAQKNNRKYYIQVASNLSSKSTRLREIRPFVLANNQIQKILVINSAIKETLDEDGFTVIGATDFLLRYIK